jgi:hypothetical protein
MSASFEKRITIGNQIFIIDTSLYAQARRELYFQHYPNTDQKLTKDENRLLTTLGIDDAMIASMRTYMAKFFEQLPACQTDSSLILSQACEIPHYVIWSTQFAASNKLAQLVEQSYALHPPRTDIAVAIDDAIIHSMAPKTRELGVHDQLFQLIRVAPATAPAQPLSEYDQLFQFIRV